MSQMFNECSLSQSLTALDHDFRGSLERTATFLINSHVACIQVGLVNTIDVEMPESFFVRLSLDDTPHSGRIRLSENEDEVEGEVEIRDDDGAVASLLHNDSSHVLFLLSEGIIGLERTNYQLRQGYDVVRVCVYISYPTRSQTRCPITFPIDILFRLVEPSPGTVTSQ